MSIHFVFSLLPIPAVFTVISVAAPTTERTTGNDGWIVRLLTEFTHCVIHFVDDQLAEIVDYAQMLTPILINAVGTSECNGSNVNTGSIPVARPALDWELL